jgi:hypothetical protein
MVACMGWFCGHWHKDKYFYDMELKREYRYLYGSTAVLRGDEIVLSHRVYLFQGMPARLHGWASGTSAL